MGRSDNEERWLAVGRELAMVDPVRFERVLSVAEQIVALHRDPMSVDLPDGSAMPPAEDPERSQ